MIKCGKTTLIGFQVRARKMSGGKWLVYCLKDPDRPDFVGNRKAVDIVYSRKAAYFMIRDLDEPAEERTVEHEEN